MAPRRQRWAGFDLKQVSDLIGDDMDAFEHRMDMIDARLGKIMAVCLAILTTLVGSLILLALNLATGG